MQIIESIAEWRYLRTQAEMANKTIGLVPTMGNLHQGHLSLLKRSVSENEITVLTLFVNPTQFNNANDLQNYPRTFKQDRLLAEQANVTYLFRPAYEDIYPDRYRYKVIETEFSQQFCGKHRPGHFNGVLTIVMKLLMLIKARYAYFGEKDFQQLQLVKELTEAFFIDTEIVGCSTIRAEDGLALSSRNNLLTTAQRQLAANFPHLLSSNLSIDEIIEKLQQLGFAVEYIEEYHNRRLAAVRLGDVRLIDNVSVSLS